MKKKKIGIYVALALLGSLFFPFFLLNFFDPDWLVRLICVAFFVLEIPLCVAVYVFGPVSNFGPEIKPLWSGKLTRFAWGNELVATRFLLGALLLILTMTLTVPVFTDIIKVAKNASVTSEQATIKQETANSLAGIFFREIHLFTDSGLSGSFTAPFFSSPLAENNQRYRVYYLPISKVILDMEREN